MPTRVSVVVTFVDGEPTAEVDLEYEEIDEMCAMTGTLIAAADLLHTRAHQAHELDKLRN